MFVTSAFAQETAPAATEGDTHSGTGVPAEAHGAFPPFDPATFPSQRPWLAITFGLFYLFLKKVVMPRLGGIIDVRNDRISQDLDHGTCKIETTDTVEMNPRQPCAVDPLEPVHRVYNPREFNQRAVSLHVYSRPFDTCVVYSQEQGTCGVIKLHYQTQYGKPGI